MKCKYLLPWTDISRVDFGYITLIGKETWVKLNLPDSILLPISTLNIIRVSKCENV
jgi:hypothetical protein